VFQPAEEGRDGAEQMLAAKVLENPAPQYTLCLHLWNERPLGWVGITPGPMMSGADRFHVRLIGRGGHGAAPHQTTDPVIAAAQVIVALQNIVSRNLNPLRSAVLSVTQVKAGDAYNVIPQTAEFGGTIRTFEPEVRQLVHDQFEKIVLGVSAGMGCDAEFDIKRLTPPVINNPGVTARVAEAVQMVLPDAQIDSHYQTMISEDMAFFMEQVPGCYMLVGSASFEKGLDFGHHHPRFDFDEDVLPRASAAIASAAVALTES
jgi:amidohydrolase